MYKARKGQGAFCDDEPIQVSDVKGNTYLEFLCSTSQDFELFSIFENNRRLGKKEITQMKLCINYTCAIFCLDFGN